MHEQIGREAFIRKMKRNLPKFVEHLPDLPEKIHKVINDAQSGNLEIKWKSDELTQLRKELQYNHRHTVAVIAGCCLLLCGSIFLLFGAYSLIPYTATTLIGTILSLLGVIIILSNLLT